MKKTYKIISICGSVYLMSWLCHQMFIDNNKWWHSPTLILLVVYISILIAEFVSGDDLF